MTSAIRDGRLPTLVTCSAAAILAASSARLFSAAWAPSTSDAVPINAAATPSERREMRSRENWPNKLITGLIRTHCSSRAVLCRASCSPSFGIGGRFAVELCSICGVATNKRLTRSTTCPQPYLSVKTGWEPDRLCDSHHRGIAVGQTVSSRHFLENTAPFMPLLSTCRSGEDAAPRRSTRRLKHAERKVEWRFMNWPPPCAGH